MSTATPIDDSSSPAAPPSRRFSLLLGPWRTSSRVVAVLVLLFLVFCNVPGQYVERLRFGDLPPLVADIGTDTGIEHGWPMTFLTRSREVRSFGPEITIGECFEFWRDLVEFRAGSLLANLVIVLVLSLVIGAGFELWRRARNRLFQIHLRDLLAGLLVLSAVGAWFLNQRQQHAALERSLRQERLPNPYWTYDARGIMWLRLLLGDWLFSYLDRPSDVTVSGSDQWPQLAGLTTARRVDAIGQPSTADLTWLVKLHNLEALTLQEFGQAGGMEFELPPIPRLRGLHLSSISGTCRGIDRAPLLEVVSISESKVDDRTFQELSRLIELRELSLDVKVTADQLLALSSLPKLRALALENATLDASALRALGRFQGLTYLELWGCSLAEGELKEVASLPQLQTLRLRGTNVASQDLAPLVGLPLKELYLSGTQVDRAAIPHLFKLSHLRELVLPRRGFSDADEQLLRERLPKCEIHFER